MNAYIHSEISVKKRGGKIEDYYAIHHFMDSTKELCSDNRHRILHTLWGIRRVIIPIFGKYIVNSDSQKVNVKDLCEQDHILADYRNRFIPTLSDFVSCIDESAIKNWIKQIESTHELYRDKKEIKNLLISPLSISGELKSLLITHNSWFLNEILPLIFNEEAKLIDFPIAPHHFFNSMSFQLWMDNGADYPPSAKFLKKMTQK